MAFLQTDETFARMINMRLLISKPAFWVCVALWLITTGLCPYLMGLQMPGTIWTAGLMLIFGEAAIQQTKVIYDWLERNN